MYSGKNIRLPVVRSHYEISVVKLVTMQSCNLSNYIFTDNIHSVFCPSWTISQSTHRIDKKQEES